MRKFDEWLKTMNESISNFGYYVDFQKVYMNVNKISKELNTLNGLTGTSKENIKEAFIKLANEHPEVIKCIPLLIAVRTNRIKIYENENLYFYNFDKMDNTIQEYADFLENIGLLDLFSEHKITNLLDYMLGVEVGLDSNARKNRGGHLMEDIVENYIIELEVPYDKEIYASALQQKFNIDLSSIVNKGKGSKRFDFAFYKNNQIYVVETNYYASSGSKLNETARSYEMIAEESKNIPNFHFIWITDGLGWKNAKKNLEETFDVLPTLFNLNDLKNNELKKLIGLV